METEPCLQLLIVLSYIIIIVDDRVNVVANTSKSLRVKVNEVYWISRRRVRRIFVAFTIRTKQ